MQKIIRGTTPTITYTFNTIDVATIVTAILTVKRGTTILEKDLTSATVGEKSLSWTLTQQETLKFSGDNTMMLNWKLTDGTRGASEETKVHFSPNHKNEVI